MPSQPQTVLTVLTGGAREAARALAHGAALQPFGVGTQGAWAIFAPGVELVHFFIGFDGTQVHVAKASPSYQLSIAGIEIGQGWHIVPVPCELQFGGACIAVTSDEKRLITQPFGRAGEVSNEPLLPAGQIRTQFIARPGPAPSEAAPATPLHGFAPVQPTPHHVVGGQGLSGTAPLGTQVPPQQPAFGATVPLRASPGGLEPQPAVQPQFAPQPHAPVPQGYPKLEPTPAVVLGHAQPPAAHAPLQAHVQVPPAGAPGAHAYPINPSAPTMNSAGAVSVVESGPRTLGDGGALREHAARVAQATPSVAFASAQAYAADVQRASGSTPPPQGNLPVPERPPGAFTPQPQAAPPVAEPLPPPAAVQAPVESGPEPKKASGLAASWREASLIKKLTLVLLPFGLVGVVLMPDEAPPQQDAPRRPSAASSAALRAGAAASGSGAPLAQSSALGAANRAEPVGSAAPAASSSASPSGSASATSASPTSSAAPVAGGSASAGPVVALVAPTSSAAAPAPSAQERSSRASAAVARDAVYAAFEGRSAAAAKLYERLASSSGDRVFVLAARLAREDQVRKPVISH